MVELPPERIGGASEVAGPFPEASSDLGKFVGPKYDEHDYKDNYKLGKANTEHAAVLAKEGVSTPRKKYRTDVGRCQGYRPWRATAMLAEGAFRGEGRDRHD